MQGLRRCANDVVQLDLSTPTPPTNNSNSSSSLSIDVDESTEARIRRLISEHPVIIFTRSSCCMCHVMKKLLATIGVNPTVIELDDHEIAALPDNNPHTATNTIPLRNPTPAVFIGGASIGGLESLVALHVSGHLVPKLVQVGALWRGWNGSATMVMMITDTRLKRVTRVGREHLCSVTRDKVVVWSGLDVGSREEGTPIAREDGGESASEIPNEMVKFSTGDETNIIGSNGAFMDANKLHETYHVKVKMDECQSE
ncbi:hypothetical protein VNO78_29010 [Psophocarpus tetragonolobus]|uniref:Glutaredoxin domain-containing protein n=1 Tax=Psophocarpus tetragonolobus TaxID=3891 RepID=A0AAN9RU79_PSOTE